MPAAAQQIYESFIKYLQSQEDRFLDQPLDVGNELRTMVGMRKKYPGNKIPGTDRPLPKIEYEWFER